MNNGAAECGQCANMAEAISTVSGENKWIAEMHAHRQVRERAMKIYGKAASTPDRVARGASATIL